MKNIYVRIANWKLKELKKPYQRFVNSITNNDLSGDIKAFMRDTNSKFEDVQIYVFETKKQYEEAYNQYCNDLSMMNNKNKNAIDFSKIKACVKKIKSYIEEDKILMFDNLNELMDYINYTCSEIETKVNNYNDVIKVVGSEYTFKILETYYLIQYEEAKEILNYIPNTKEQEILVDLAMSSSQPYISASLNYCYRSYGSFAYYSLLCEQLNIKIKCVSSGLSYEAKGNGYELEWVEHDIILALPNEEE